MKQLIVIAGIMIVLTFFSVIAESAEVLENTGSSLPVEFEETSIEVGFTQGGEREPHFLAEARDGEVTVVSIERKYENAGRRIAQETPTMVSKPLATEIYVQRMRQALEAEKIYQSKEVRQSRSCKDRYILRISHNHQKREYLGCANKEKDPFSGFAQNMYRDSFQAWHQGM